MLALSTAGRCGSPAPTTMTGSPACPISWHAAHSAETSSGPRSCISSTNTETPLPVSAARPPRSVSSSTRSISMSPESARPRTAGTSMPELQRSRSLAAPASRSANARTTPSAWSDSSCCGWPSSRTAWCSALASGLRSRWSGRASSLPVPQPLRTAWLRSALSRTVLPTPRSPVRTRLRSERFFATRSSTTSNARSCSSRPGELGRTLAGAGRVRVPDRVHARTVSGCLADSLDLARRRSAVATRRELTVRRIAAGSGGWRRASAYAEPRPRDRNAMKSGTSATESRNEPDADVLPPHRQDDERRPRRATRVAARGRHPDHRGRPRCPPSTHDAPGREICHRFVDSARAGAARGRSAGPRPGGPARRARDPDDPPGGVQCPQDLRPAAARAGGRAGRGRHPARQVPRHQRGGSPPRHAPGARRLGPLEGRGPDAAAEAERPQPAGRPRRPRRHVRPRRHRGGHQEEPGHLRRAGPAGRAGHRQPRPGPADRRLHPRVPPRHPRRARAASRSRASCATRAPSPASATPTPTRSCTPPGCRRSSRRPRWSRGTTTATSWSCTTPSGSPSATRSTARAGSPRAS